MSRLTERLSQEPKPPSIGPRPEAEHYQRHPIPGQLCFTLPSVSDALAAGFVAKCDCEQYESGDCGHIAGIEA